MFTVIGYFYENSMSLYLNSLDFYNNSMISIRGGRLVRHCICEFSFNLAKNLFEKG